MKKYFSTQIDDILFNVLLIFLFIILVLDLKYSSRELDHCTLSFAISLEFFITCPLSLHFLNISSCLDSVSIRIYFGSTPEIKMCGSAVSSNLVGKVKFGKYKGLS